MSPARGRRPAEWLALALGVAGVVLAVFVRLAAHPGSYFDGEGQIPATIGRELFLNGAADVFRYQLVAYQGSLVVDSLLASVGYAVFGDQLLAWHSVGLLYAGLTALFGALVLRRVAGPLAALAWLLLLASAPFVLKDGLLAIVGGHAVGPAWALAAMFCALHAGTGRRGLIAAAAAGLLLGFGSWYLRTVIVTLPALAWVVGRKGRRPLLAFGAGACILVVLLGLNVELLAGSGRTQYESMSRQDLLEQVIGGGQVSSAGPVEKFSEASGFGVHTLLFAQPAFSDGSEVPYRPSALQAGRLWSIAWLVGLAAVFLGLLHARRPPASDAEAPEAEERLDVGDAAGVAALSLLWIAAYLLSPNRVEENVLSVASEFQRGSHAVGVNAIRYLVPLQLSWTLLLALGLGLLRRIPGLSRLVLPLLLLPVLSGGVLASLDWLADRDPGPSHRSIQPYYYASLQQAGRLPPAQLHLRSLGDDSQSRAFHLSGLANWAGSNPSQLLAHPDTEVQRIAELAGSSSLADADREVLASAFGAALAEQVREPRWSRSDVFEAARRSARAFGGAAGRSYLEGFREVIERLDGPRAELQFELCTPSLRAELCPW